MANGIFRVEEVVARASRPWYWAGGPPTLRQRAADHVVLYAFASVGASCYHDGFRAACRYESRDADVKLVIAVIQPTKLDSVRDALEKLEVTRMTVCDAQGFGRQRGQMTETPDTDAEPKVLRKVVLEVTVNDDFLERTVDTIIRIARNGPKGAIGDGKIFIIPSVEAIQIDSGTRGPGAV